MNTLPPRPPVEQLPLSRSGSWLPQWAQWFCLFFTWATPKGSTGSGTPLLGANCPASELAAPHTWIEMTAPDGTVICVPGWKK